MSYDFYAAWNKKEHKKLFDVWNAMSKNYFKFIFGCFYENKYLINQLKKNPNLNILDVGCATGQLFRYLKIKKVLVNYFGVDISENCIQKAQEIHGKDFFKRISAQNLTNQLAGKKYDIVYSRDTVLHQLEPLKFISNLINVTDDTLILRLRTRDLGSTIYDPEHSCQLEPGEVWAPYIVINYDELIKFFKNLSIIKEVIVNKSYTILGGQNLRFLDKNLYLKKTGTAETTIIISIDRNTKKEFKLYESSYIEGHNYLKKNKYKDIFFKVMNKFSI